jgi:transcriptional regulator with XRE-family HTH domain
MQEWASRLHELMTKAGRTQAELARACGLKPGSVSGWFGQGKPTKMISGDNLVAAAQFLNTTAEFIMTGRGSRETGVSMSHVARLDDATMAQGVELMYLLADARPEDGRLKRPSWAMLQVAAKAVQRAKGDPREAMAEILAALAKET